MWNVDSPPGHWRPEQTAMWFEAINKTASTHFIGSMPIAESAAKGVVDP